MMSQKKVLIIDDSALVRQVLEKIISQEENFEVVGSARDPLYAIKKIKDLQPDILTLDLQMPRMDGLTFLRKLMAIYPLPVIVISSLTEKGSKETIKALELGALDFVAKPRAGISNGLENMAVEITEKLKSAARVNMGNLKYQSKTNHYQKVKEPVKIRSKTTESTIELIAIGASTGGTIAVRNILNRLPAKMPPLIIVIHMPRSFTKSYAENLNNSCELTVKEAQAGEELQENVAYIAPGDHHLTIEKGVSNNYYVKLDKGPKINHVRPAIDNTFISIANTIAPNCLGVILTGMGSDGAKGLKMMYDRNTYTIAQDENSSIVFGMPKKAIEFGAVREILPLNKISEKIMDKI
jgi:two-component system chemotaxis response regulator CheB